MDVFFSLKYNFPHYFEVQVHVDETHSDTRSAIQYSLSLYVSIHPFIQVVTGLLMVFSVIDVVISRGVRRCCLLLLFRFVVLFLGFTARSQIPAIRDNNHRYKNETPHGTFLTPLLTW